MASAVHFLGILHNSDVVYTPLPLYHTAGGVMAMGQALLHGHTVVIRKKFSASSYFSDCMKYKCTVSNNKFCILNQLQEHLFDLVFCINFY